jgi:HEAT repeat protein
MAARRHDDTAAQAIWDLHGKIGGLMDPTLDALATLGAPALPYLTGLLPSCGRRELAKGRLDDPKATIELEEAGLAASAIQVILDQDAKAKAPGLASKLIATFDCGDATVRQIAAQALGLLETLEGQDAEALRTRLAGDRRDDVRAFSASVLAAHQVADSKTIKLLERALSHRADLVRLSAANALMKLNQPKRAQPTLVQLTRSRDPEIARLAESLLRP